MSADFPKSAQPAAAGAGPGPDRAAGPHSRAPAAGRAHTHAQDHVHCEGHGAHLSGLNLTPGRRAILDLLCGVGGPLGAYDMIDRLAASTGRRPAPIAVYRALDYLLDHGLVHRLASRNAFVACGRRHAHAEPVVFLICDACGRVEESASPDISRSLAETAAAAGFRSQGAVIEVSGACAACANDVAKHNACEKATP